MDFYVFLIKERLKRGNIFWNVVNQKSAFRLTPPDKVDEVVKHVAIT